MQFSDLFKPSTSRVSYVPRQGYGKLPPPINAPKIDNLFLSDACGFSLPFDSSISMEQYLMAVGDIVGDEKMVFAGKSNDNIKIYLINEAEVLKFYENNPQVVINNKPLAVRKLINNGHKIYLCNTKPGIPDSLLITEISKYTKILSPIKFVSLGVRNARFSHLIGFKRSVMVEEVDDLPGFINVFFEDYIHKIFITIDRVKCFRCQGEGHLVKNCSLPPPKSAQERLVQDDDENVPNVQQAPPLNSVNKDLTQLFVPAFASRTRVGTPSPLNENEFVSPSSVPQVSQELPSSVTPPPVVLSVEAVVHQSSTPSVADSNPKSSQEVSDKTVTPSVGESSDVDMNASDSEVEVFASPMIPMSSAVGGKKRGSSTSPDNSGTDKKICVAPPSKLDVLIPLISECEPLINPEVFINLLNDMKNQTGARKVDIIKSNYSLDPQAIASLCEKLVLDNAAVLHKQLKSRLKNLHKSIMSVLKDVGPSPPPPASS
ncbi:hypothetical protein M8J77_025623 [Diaphorina citri]|nr:hypothetical protein M8J77_025623 [Diaphorina citri]